MKELSNNKTINYISLLNVISAIAVVILHSNGVTFWRFKNTGIWAISNVIESIFYFAVPIFLMITGITLIDYRDRYDTKVFFKKRIKKVVIPFIFFSIFGLFYLTYISKVLPIEKFNIVKLFNVIIDTKYMGIYWFFIPLFIVYLCMPLLSSVNKKDRKNVFLYLLGCFIVFNSVIPFLNEVLKLGLSLPIKMIIGTEYLMYPIIGYLLHNYEIDKRKEYVIYVFGVISLLIHIVMTYNLSIQTGGVVETYKGYNSIFCVLYSTAVFLFIRNISGFIRSKKFFNLINTIKNYTFAIYLLHWFVMDLSTFIFGLKTNSLIYILGLPVFIIIFCISLTYIIRKIPVIRRILP